jgi:uncharacterized protein
MGFREDRDRASEAGKKGSETLRARYGVEHFRAMGKRGGDTTKEKGSDYFRQIGQRGLQKRWGKEEGGGDDGRVDG